MVRDAIYNIPMKQFIFILLAIVEFTVSNDVSGDQELKDYLPERKACDMWGGFESCNDDCHDPSDLLYDDCFLKDGEKNVQTSTSGSENCACACVCVFDYCNCNCECEYPNKTIDPPICPELPSSENYVPDSPNHPVNKDENSCIPTENTLGNPNSAIQDHPNDHNNNEQLDRDEMIACDPTDSTQDNPNISQHDLPNIGNEHLDNDEILCDPVDNTLGIPNIPEQDQPNDHNNQDLDRDESTFDPNDNTQGNPNDSQTDYPNDNTQGNPNDPITNNPNIERDENPSLSNNNAQGNPNKTQTDHPNDPNLERDENPSYPNDNTQGNSNNTQIDHPNNSENDRDDIVPDPNDNTQGNSNIPQQDSSNNISTGSSSPSNSSSTNNNTDIPNQTPDTDSESTINAHNPGRNEDAQGKDQNSPFRGPSDNGSRENCGANRRDTSGDTPNDQNRDGVRNSNLPNLERDSFTILNSENTEPTNDDRDDTLRRQENPLRNRRFLDSDYDIVAAENPYNDEYSINIYSEKP